MIRVKRIVEDLKLAPNKETLLETENVNIIIIKKSNLIHKILNT